MSRYQRIHFKNQTTRYFRKKGKQKVRLIWLVDGWLIERETRTSRVAGWLVVSFVFQEKTKGVFIHILSSNQPTIAKYFLCFFANCFGR